MDRERNGFLGQSCQICFPQRSRYRYTFSSRQIFHLHFNLFIPAAYRPDAIQAVLLLASELYAVQTVGAATSHLELDFICASFDVNFARLQPSGYNTTLIKEIFCAAAEADSLPPSNQIRQLTIEISSFIWIVQAIGAVQGNVQTLCRIISLVGASAIGLQGDLVKNDICAAAAVANKIAISGQPAALTLTVPTVASIAPVSTVVLPFVPVTATPSA